MAYTYLVGVNRTANIESHASFEVNSKKKLTETEAFAEAVKMAKEHDADPDNADNEPLHDWEEDNNDTQFEATEIEEGEEDLKEE